MYGIDFPRTELPIDPVETNGYFDVSISISLMQSLYEKLNSGIKKLLSFCLKMDIFLYCALL